MAIAALTAHKKNDVAKNIRREGFTPAVVYGFGYEDGKAIMFKTSELLATIRRHGMNARVTVDIEGDSVYGAIKEVQLHPVTNAIRHIDIYLFNKSDVVSLTVPIHFTGMDELMIKRFVVGTLLNEIEVTGPAMDIPQSLTLDLSDKTAGDVVTVADLNINPDLRLSSDLTETLVTISEAQEEPEEVDENAESTEPELVNQEAEEA